MADQSEEGTNGVWYWGNVCGERAERVDGIMERGVRRDVSMTLYPCSRG